MPITQKLANTLVFTTLVAATSLCVASGLRPADRDSPPHADGLLNSDGRLDTTFGFAGLRPIAFDDGGDDFDDGLAVAVQSDGKIVVAGTISYDGGSGQTKAIGVTRLLPDGTALDPTFGSNGTKILPGPQNNAQQVTGIALQADGKILLSGWYQGVGQAKEMLVYRLRPNGDADTGFGVLGRAVNPLIGSGNDAVLQALAVQDDGKIVGAGWYQFSGTDHDFVVIRLNANGSLDSSFNGSGENAFGLDAGNGNDDRGYALTIDFYGNILVAGSATSSAGGNGRRFAAVRFSPSGAVDTGFGNAGGALIPIPDADESGALAVALSYDVLRPMYTLAGYRHWAGNDYDFALVQLDADGNPGAPAFGVRSIGVDLGGAGRDIGRAIIAENRNAIGEPYDARFTIGGFAYNFATGNYDFAAVRILGNGDLDATFGPHNNGRTAVAFDLDPAPSTHNDFANAMAMQGSRVILAGTVARSGHNGADADFGITRLTSDIIFANDFENQ